MKNYFDNIEKKLRKNINFEKIEIIDNSHKHKSHKSFLPNKLHLALNIKSNYLISLPKLDAHKLIMKVLEDELKNKIHALEIKIYS